MDNYIDRFRNKVALYSTIDEGQVDIISVSLSKTEVYHVRLDKTIPSIFIPNDKEVADESIMYTYRIDDVRKGDYISVLNEYHLVLDDIKDVKREGFIDTFRLIECNAIINGESFTDARGYFLGSFRSTSGRDQVNLAASFGVDLKTEALIIIPSYNNVKLNEEISIQEEHWRVLKKDTLTNSGISYITAERVNKIHLDKVSGATSPVTNPEELKSGSIYYFDTEDGYINFNMPVEIINRSSTTVEIRVPYTLGSLTVDYKENGVILTKSFIIRR